MDRQLQKIIAARPSTDGAGVAIQRVAGFEDPAMELARALRQDSVDTVFLTGV